MSTDKHSSQIMKQIDENLRRVFKETEQEEIPDRLRSLLSRLKTQDRPTDTDE